MAAAADLHKHSGCIDKLYGRSQANQVSHVGENKFLQRLTPYEGGGCSYGQGFVSNNAVQVSPPQEVQFNYDHTDCGAFELGSKGFNTHVMQTLGYIQCTIHTYIICLSVWF